MNAELRRAAVVPTPPPPSVARMDPARDPGRPPSDYPSVHLMKVEARGSAKPDSFRTIYVLEAQSTGCIDSANPSK